MYVRVCHGLFSSDTESYLLQCWRGIGRNPLTTLGRLLPFAACCAVAQSAEFDRSLFPWRRYYKPGVMRMCAVQAGHSTRYSLHRLTESHRQFDLFAGTGEKLRTDTAAQILVLAPEFQ